MSAPSGWRAEVEAFALRVANAGAEGPPTDGPTFRGLDSEDRAAVHDAARELGLASKSEGSDDDGTRAVHVFARKRPAWTHASAGMANGDARASAAEADDTAAAADASPHGPSAFDESLMDTRDAPFDMYKALRTRGARVAGTPAGPRARARATTGRPCGATRVGGRPGSGACDGCGGALRLGRWMHRPAPPRADAPADDPEFGLMDDEEDDGGTRIVASAVCVNAGTNAGAREPKRRTRADASPPTPPPRRPPCFARETRARPWPRARRGDVHAADPAEGFAAVASFATSGASAQDTTSRRTRRPRAARGGGGRGSGGERARARRRRRPGGDGTCGGDARGEGRRRRGNLTAPIERKAAPQETKEMTRFAEVARFQRVTIAYLTLRDPERLRVLDEHGYAALVGSEALSEHDVFDCDPWDVTSASSPARTRRTGSTCCCTAARKTATTRTSRDASDGDSDDDAFVEEALREAKHERFEKAEESDKRAAALAPPPKPPVSVLMAMGGEPGGVGRGAEDDDELPARRRRRVAGHGRAVRR